jgi:hypothetical protein
VPYRSRSPATILVVLSTGPKTPAEIDELIRHRLLLGTEPLAITDAGRRRLQHALRRLQHALRRRL